MNTSQRETQSNVAEVESFDSILRRLVRDICLTQPKEKDLCLYMTKWLLKNGGYTGSLLKNDEKGELEKLRKVIRKYRKYDSHMKGQGVVQPQNDFSDDDPDDIDPELNKIPKTTITEKLNVRYNFMEQKEVLDKPPKKVQKSQEDIIFIKTNIMQLPFFNNFDAKELEKIIDYFTVKDFEPGQKIINFDDDVNCFYLIKNGQLDCYKKFPDKPEKLIMEFKSADYYGEIAFLQKSKSPIKLEATQKGQYFELPGDAYYYVKREAEKKTIDFHEKIIKKVPIFKTLQPKEVSLLAGAVKSGVYYEDEVIYRENDEGDLLYYIETGECNAAKECEPGKPKEIIKTYKAGEILGERAMIAGITREEELVAASPIVKLASIDRQSFEELIGSIEEVLKRDEKLYNEYFKEEKKEEVPDEKNESVSISKGGLSEEKAINANIIKGKPLEEQNQEQNIVTTVEKKVTTIIEEEKKVQQKFEEKEQQTQKQEQKKEEPVQQANVKDNLARKASTGEDKKSSYSNEQLKVVNIVQEKKINETNLNFPENSVNYKGDNIVQVPKEVKQSVNQDFEEDVKI